MRRIEIPICIAYEPLAKGLIELFTSEEKDILRFGMLPAKKMETLEKLIKERILGFAVEQKEGNTYLYTTSEEQRDKGWPDVIEFDINRVTADVVHNVCLKIYEHGNLVV